MAKSYTAILLILFSINLNLSMDTYMEKNLISTIKWMTDNMDNIPLFNSMNMIMVFENPIKIINLKNSIDMIMNLTDNNEKIHHLSVGGPNENFIDSVNKDYGGFQFDQLLSYINIFLCVLAIPFLARNFFEYYNNEDDENLLMFYILMARGFVWANNIIKSTGYINGDRDFYKTNPQLYILAYFINRIYLLFSPMEIPALLDATSFIVEKNPILTNPIAFIYYLITPLTSGYLSALIDSVTIAINDGKILQAFILVTSFLFHNKVLDLFTYENTYNFIISISAVSYIFTVIIFLINHLSSYNFSSFV